MAFIVRLVSLGLFIVSFCIILLILWFYYTFSHFSPSIKIVKKTSTHSLHLNFEELLGKFFKTPKKQELVIPSLPLTLPSLKAIFWNGKNSIALLAIDKEELWLTSGDSVKGWKVKQIYPDHVILRYENGKEVTLSLFEEEANEHLHAHSFQMKNFLEEKNSSEVFLISKEKVKSLMADMGSLFSKIGLRPYLEGGRIKGLQVIYIAPHSIFQQVGLRKGDVILSINNIPVKTNEDAFRIIETLQSSSFIKVKILRNGSLVELKVEVV